MLKEITGSEIRLSYSNYSFNDIEAGEKIIGQDKALGLLRLGLSMNRYGYNIFISGEDGTGRLSAIRQEIEKIEKDVSGLKDAAYAYSSKHPNRPTCLIFEKGKAREFQKDLYKYKDGEITKEQLLYAFQDEKIARFVNSLPPYDENQDAWKINIVLDRTGFTRRPLVIETHPSHSSLFGSIEKDLEPHLSVRVGSYQEASGGFLVLNAAEIVEDEELWTSLKRYLDMTHRAISSTAVQGEMSSSVRPSPIPLPTKVILLGSEELYNKLIDRDDLFLKFFKISPEFDFTMDATKENINGTVSYLKSAGKNLLKQEGSAYHEILRYSSWLAEDRKRLTTQLSLLGDLLEEASVEAIALGKETVDGYAVKAALSKRDWYNSMAEEHINKEIEDGVMVMTLKGERVGVVNGLAVMDRGLSSFGTPTVISATVAPGTEGIVNIEHEAGLSGNIHDKGLLILEGYLRHKYARTFPLSLYAGICFEQSYGEVDGDSASSAELYALLSAIGDIPIRQDLAVTGSVNQMGELQPVGGINEKIQGFYNACLTLGLTGTQGVIIPAQNLSSVILPYQVEKAIEDGKFHLYSISSIDEGMELLSGLTGGERDKKGLFPIKSFHRIVEEELKELYRNSQKQ